MTDKSLALLAKVQWNQRGLVPAIAQDHISGEVLMMAWMNHEALSESIRVQRATYWSRSRNKLWRKGETSGNYQEIRDIFLDCDGDTILLKVIQHGGIACHTGRYSCFYHRLDDLEWKESSDILKDPNEMYKT